MDAVGTVEEDWTDGSIRPVLRVVMVAVSVLGFAVVTVPMSRFWLGVAWSAFAGDRAEADFTLGVLSVVVAVVPLAAGGVTWLVRHCQPGSTLMQIAAGLAMSVVVALPGLLYAAAVSVI